MSSTTSITELRSMPLSDLYREVRSQQTHVRKMRLQITMKTDKDTARYRREKKQLARMMMVLGEKGDEGDKGVKGDKENLKQKPKTATVAPSKKSPTSKRIS